MKRIVISLSCLLLLATSATSYAGKCDLNYTRTACAGQEATSFNKCDGKASCTKTIDAASADACRTKAVAACANVRLDITKSKIISATFDGKPVLNKAGAADHCLDYAERASEFNHCSK